MRQTGGRRFGALLAVLCLGGCDVQETGYVQVQLGRAGFFGAPPLYLNGVKLDFSRGSMLVMRFRTGRISLKTSDSAWSPAICRIDVRNNRISVLSVAAAESPPRCICQIQAADSTPTETICT